MFSMYDSVTLGTVPDNAYALAGYTSGYWPTYEPMVQQFPKLAKAGRIVSIAVNVEHDAMCLDVEPGDASPDQVVGWVERQMARGVKRPIIYTSISGMQDIVDRLAKAGIGRHEVRLWSAHYSHGEHLCGPQCNARINFGFTDIVDATQWTSNALGRNLDQSVCEDDFLSTKVPVDHHYDWFYTVTVGGKIYNEQATVRQYDQFRNRSRLFIFAHRSELKNLRATCKLLADRVARVALYDPKTGKKRDKALWGQDHRGWRYQQLLARSRGERVK